MWWIDEMPETENKIHAGKGTCRRHAQNNAEWVKTNKKKETGMKKDLQIRMGEREKSHLSEGENLI